MEVWFKIINLWNDLYNNFRYLIVIVLLIIGLPPIILFFIPPNIDFNIDGTPGKTKTFSK